MKPYEIHAHPVSPCRLAVGAPQAGNWIANHEIVGVRTETAKLIYHPTWKNGPFWEHSDLTADPREMKNLYYDPSRQKDVATLEIKLRELAGHYQDVEAIQTINPGRKP